jgi:hypothetical protein
MCDSDTNKKSARLCVTDPGDPCSDSSRDQGMMPHHKRCLRFPLRQEQAQIRVRANMIDSESLCVSRANRVAENDLHQLVMIIRHEWPFANGFVVSLHKTGSMG